MSLFELTLLCVVGGCAYVFWQNSGLQDRAIALAKLHCDRNQVQLLDETVALVRTRLKRNRKGVVAIARSYKFEFTSTGERRYQGELELLGKQIVGIELEPHRIPTAPTE